MIPYRKIQLFPAVRVVLMLILGIMVGDQTWRVVPVYVWPALLAVLLIPTAVFRFRDRCESVLLLSSTFLVGAAIVTIRERRNVVELPRQEVIYEAVIASQPEIHGKTLRCDLLVVSAKRPFRLKASILRDTVTGRWKRIGVGDGIVARSVLHVPTNFPSASNFDYRRWASVHGIAGQTFIHCRSWYKAAIDLTPLSRLERTRLRALQLRASLVKRFSRLGLDDGQLALVAAMTLGDKSKLTKELKSQFAVSGASHVLALSGLHLGIIYTILLLCFPRHRWRVVSQSVVLLVIWTYAVLVGLTPSVVRASLMITLYGMLSLLHRDQIPLNTLAFAALVMLVANPLTLWDVGFQMSFLAVLGILLFFRMIYLPLAGRLLRLGRWVWGMLAVSLSAQLMVAPLILYYFGRFSCYFLLTNLIVVPAATVILYLTFFLVLAAPWAALQQVVAMVLAQTAAWMNRGVAWISTLPGASIEQISIRLSQVIGMYLLVFSVYFLIRFIQFKLAYKQHRLHPR